jgi:hypothetical protein
MTNGSSALDGQAFEAVRELVQQGEYLDELPGVPGRRLRGGGGFQDVPGRGKRRLYQRGTPEHLEARDAGDVEKLPALPCATAAAVADVEHLVGFPLPRLLRRLYLELANGGFGPGYGVLGLADGHRDDQGVSAPSLHEKWRVSPRSLLPICHWGCGIYSFVDCATDEGIIWAYDPNPLPPSESKQGPVPTDKTLAEWLLQWTKGALCQPTFVQDRKSLGWRAATDEEIAAMLAEV